jgi:hypothetical protein
MSEKRRGGAWTEAARNDEVVSWKVSVDAATCIGEEIGPRP